MTEFVLVSKKHFYSVVNPMDVRCRPQKMETIWEGPGRTIIGRSTPGYLCRDEAGRYVEVKTYFLRPQFVNRSMETKHDRA